jgi:hypothetical protein
MTTRLRRFLGFLMLLTAAGGLIFTVYIGSQVWRMRPAVTEMLDSNIALLKDMVITSSDLLVLVDSTLQTASDELDILLESILSMSNIMQDAGPLIDSLQTLTGENLPATLAATQTSLDTAQQSADIIDNFLRLVSRIPFFPGDPYNPEVPLSESLSRISNSLDSITPAMVEIQTNLASSKESIAEIDTQLASISDSAVKLQKNLSDAQITIQRYHEQMEEVQSRLTQAQLAVPKWVDRVAWTITLLLVWLGLAQAGLLVQGIYLLTKPA